MALLFSLLVLLGGRFYSRFRGSLPWLTLFLFPVLGLLCLAVLFGLAFGYPEASRRFLEAGRAKLQPRLAHMAESRHPLWRPLGLGGHWVLARFMQLLSELLQRPRGSRFVGIVTVSLMSMLLRFTFQWILIRGMQIQLSPMEVFFALAFTGFCNLFPIQSIAGLGAVEAPWVWALVNLGTNTQDAVVSGFSLHILVIIYSVGVGCIGWIGKRWK